MNFTSKIGNDLNTFDILVKNFPKNKQGANAETLLDFVKRLTWQENVEIEKVGPSDYSVKFINVPTDAKEVVKQLRSETYLGIYLDVGKKRKELYLENLKPGVTKMDVLIYLEQSNFLPSKATEDYQVEVIHIDSSKNVAHVRLPDEADINLYVGSTHSDFLGERLKVSEFNATNSNCFGQQRQSRIARPAQGNTPTTSSGRPSNSKSPSVRSNQRPLSTYRQPVPLPILTGCTFGPNGLKGLQFVEWLDVDEVDREKCQLMKKLLGDLRKSQGSGWNIWLDLKLHKIAVEHGDAAKLEKVVSAVKERLASMASTFLRLPGKLALAIRSGQGLSFTIKLWHARQLKAVYYFDPRKGRGMVLGENREVARRAAEALAEEFCQHIFEATLDIGEQRIDQEWKNFSSSIMKDHPVHICLLDGESRALMPHIKVVMIQGFKSDPEFSKAIMEINQKLIQLNFWQAFAQQKIFNDAKGQHISQPLMSLSASVDTNSCSHEPKSFATDHRQSINSSEAHSLELTKSTERDVENSVKMSPLVYKFFKTHLYNVVLSTKCEYQMSEKNLVIRGKERDIVPIRSVVRSVMENLVEKVAICKIDGISAGFFNEENSELRSAIDKFELEHTFAIDFNTDRDRETMMSYAFQKQNPMTEKFPDMIKELLMNFSKKKSIRCSDMFANIGLPGGIVTEKLRDSISKVEHGHVKVKYDRKSDTIIMQGREKFFTVVEKALIGIFKEHLEDNKPQKLSTNQKKIDMNLGMRTENLSDFLRAFGLEDVFAPDHWSKFTGNLRHVAGDKGQIVLLSPNSKTFKYVKDMVQSTWTNGQVGVGRDASLLNHRNIEVINIYSVENVSQYKRYMTRLKEFSLQNDGDGFSRLDSSLRVPVLTRSAAERNGLQNLLWEVNEYHLFHGTRPESRQAIIDQGLDSRLGSRHALFGQGIYFAESSTKADQYADPKENRSAPGDSLYMFVARVFMGRMHKAKKPEPYIRPPCTVAQCSSDKCSIHPLNESVLGTHTTSLPLALYDQLKARLKVLALETPISASSSKEMENIKKQMEWVRPLLFREFVVYDHAQCFPEFLIEYKRM